MAEFSGRYDVGSLESTERKFSDLGLVKRIIKDYMLRHKSLVAAMALIITAKTLLVLSGPFIYKVTLDSFISNTPEPNEKWLADIIRGIAAVLGGETATPWTSIISAGLIYIAVGVALWGVMSLQEYYLNKLGLNIIADIRTDFFLHLEKLSQNFFEYGNTGKLVSRVTNDAEALRKLVSSGIIGVVADLLTAVAILGTMFFLNFQLALVAIVMAPVLAIVTTTLNRFVRSNWRVARQNIASMTSKVQDLMVGAKVTKAMAQEEKSLSDFNKVNVANAKAQIKAEVTANIYEATVGFFAALISTLIWFFGGQQVLGAYTAIGDLVAFTQYTTSFLDPIQNISTFYGEIQSALAGAERIFVVLDIEPEVRETPDAVDFPVGEGVLELRDVSFEYMRDQPVLSGISFTTRPGERLAIFGPTGSGKSSIINLVGRFYDPKGGEVLIDGVDLRRVRLGSLRRRVAIVLQEPYLFQGTLRYNLKFGRPDASDGEMIRVAGLVGIHDAISRLPGGYDEEVSERGSNLSYGQRQLVCLARAIMADPKILILDEATSSVDPYTEQLIQGALKVEMAHRTILIVTHRVSTVRDADRIIVLEGGVIRDVGTHDQLVRRNELYRRLCEAQLVAVGQA
ncbi:ABC transporter ATP-binding protein/permease [Candidatus Bathyarchaeota archaeon]|nr:ABC transporter ATP-binding protein/permease [Candidatus Bathyarchaeota archaeon]